MEFEGGRRRRDRQDPRPRRHRQCEGGHGDRGAGGRGRGRLRRRCARARSGPCQGRGARSGSDARARCAPRPRPPTAPPPRATGSRRARSRAGSPRTRASTSRVSPDRAPMAASSRPMSRARSRAPRPRRSLPLPTAAPAPAAAPAEHKPVWFDDTIPHEEEKLSNIRKTIARRLTESKQTVPHIYLTVDIRLDALLKLRGELNASLEARGVKLSVNDLLIKALGVTLMLAPQVQRHLHRREADQVQPRRRVGRGVDTHRPHHADHPRRRQQEPLGDLDRDEGPRDAREGRKAPAARLSGRHREHLQHGDVRHHPVRRGDQSAAGHDHGDRRGREKALRGRTARSRWRR